MQFIQSLTAVSVLISGATATWLHANSGCYEVYLPSVGAGQRLCAGTGALNSGGDSNAVIFGGFSGNGQYPVEYASCAIQASWPSNYGDIYVGADGCMYDSNSNIINGACCTNAGDNVDNPYYNY